MKVLQLQNIPGSRGLINPFQLQPLTRAIQQSQASGNHQPQFPQVQAPAHPGWQQQIDRDYQQRPSQLHARTYSGKQQTGRGRPLQVSQTPIHPKQQQQINRDHQPQPSQPQTLTHSRRQQTGRDQLQVSQSQAPATQQLQVTSPLQQQQHTSPGNQLAKKFRGLTLSGSQHFEPLDTALSSVEEGSDHMDLPETPTPQPKREAQQDLQPLNSSNSVNTGKSKNTIFPLSSWWPTPKALSN